MKSKTHHMAEAISLALGPIFRANPDYKTITEAIALTVARIAQSTPDVGNEEEELELIMQTAANALDIFIHEEKTLQENRQNILDKGINGFAALVEPGSAADHPDNCDQPVAKSQQPWPPKADIEEIDQVIRAAGGTPEAWAAQGSGQ